MIVRLFRRGAPSGLPPAAMIGVVLVLVLVTSVVTWLGTRTSADAQPVQLEGAGSPGALPAFIPGAGSAAAPRRALHTEGNVVSGDAPGLYGGTETNACDVAAMRAFLEAHPDRAAAWAGALRIDPGQLNALFGSLTPVTLQTDTAVTNHGFDSGVATPFQSVLQAGTAVLVDAVGTPRVRCYCGNPLQVPIQRVAVRYEGPRWDGFDAQSVTEIATAPEPVREFVIVERDEDGEVTQVLSRPTASTGDQDVPAPPDVAQFVVANYALNLVPGPSTTGSATPTTDPSAPTTEPAPPAPPAPTPTVGGPTTTGGASVAVVPTTTDPPPATTEPPPASTEPPPATTEPPDTVPTTGYGATRQTDEPASETDGPPTAMSSDPAPTGEEEAPPPTTT